MAFPLLDCSPVCQTCSCCSPDCDCDCNCKCSFNGAVRRRGLPTRKRDSWPWLQETVLRDRTDQSRRWSVSHRSTLPQLSLSPSIFLCSSLYLLFLSLSLSLSLAIPVCLSLLSRGKFLSTFLQPFIIITAMNKWSQSSEAVSYHYSFPSVIVAFFLLV